MSNATEGPPARPSSTVVLARDGSVEPEIYMVKRHAAASFGGAFVFPGGVIDATDCDVHDHCLGMTRGVADRLLAVDDSGLDHFIAAIRELFEETGVLLAKHQTSPADLDAIREELNTASLAWRQFVTTANLRLCCDELHYFGHWITPVGLSKRFSTRFFVARMPEGMDARYDARELADGLWITASDALQAAANDELLLHFPTIKTLQQLATHASVDAMIAWADRQSADGVQAIRPVLPKGYRRGKPKSPGGSTA